MNSLNNLITKRLQKIADDAFIIGHRNAEWTGLAPTLEEDIAFSSMAQDKIGHALAIYTLLNEHFNYPKPDQYVFTKQTQQYYCCQLVQLPIQSYDFSLMRHFLFDHAEIIRYNELINSTFTPIAQIAQKIKGELKYHIFHANTWIQQLANSSPEALQKLQQSLNYAFPYALNMFESPNTPEQDQLLQTQGVMPTETEIKQQWLNNITTQLNDTPLVIPCITQSNTGKGGVNGVHTPYLTQAINEITQVFNTESTSAEW